MPRLILDVDGVVANFVQGMIEFADESPQPLAFCCWKDVDTYHFFRDDLWRRIRGDNAFWMSLRQMPGVRMKMIYNGIWPDMYLTSRPVASHITGAWLQKEFFPVAGVVTVNNPLEKIQHLLEGDIFVDDHPATIKAALAIGVKAFLMDAPFHRGCEPAEIEGLPRIRCITEIVPFLSN